MTPDGTLPGATLVLERNGEVMRARVEASFDGDGYTMVASEGTLPRKGAYKGILHWAFPEGVFTQALEVRVHEGVATGKPVEEVRRFQRRRERRYEGVFPVRFVSLNGNRLVEWEGTTRDISRHGISAGLGGSLPQITRGIFLGFRLSLGQGTVEGSGRVVDTHGTPSAGVVIRLRVNGMTEEGIALLQDWMEKQKKEELKGCESEATSGCG
jgi:hypothetical protein